MKPQNSQQDNGCRVKNNNRFSFLLLTADLVLTATVFLFFVWQVYHLIETKYSIPEQLLVAYDYFSLSVAAIVLILVVSIIAWWSTVRSLYNSQKNLLINNAEKERVEEELKLSEENFRELFENANDLIYTTDLRGNFTSLNNIGEIITGYSRAEAMKMNLSDVVAPDFVEYARAMLALKLKERVPTTYEIEIVTKAGKRVALEISNRLIYKAGEQNGVQGIARDVTARKETEEALQKSETRFRNLIETLPVYVYEVNAKPPYEPIYVSPKMAELGYPLKNWFEIPKFWMSIVHPEDRERLIRENERAIRERTGNEYEFRIVTGDGSTRWMYDKGGFIFDENNEPTRWQGVIVDVTERKIADEKLRDSQRKLQLVMDTIPQAVWWKDRNSVFVGCNQYLAEAAGFDSPEEIIGLTDYDMAWAKDETEFFLECDRRVMETGVGEFHIVEPLRQANGKQSWLETNKVPLKNAEGEIVGILGTFEDITEQRRADAALRESEYKFRTLLESMSEGLLQADTDEVIEFVNNRFCEMTGFSREELLGKTMFDLMEDEEGREYVGKANRERREGTSGHYEVRMKKKSDETLWVLVGSAPVIDAEGVVTGSMGVFTDITERKLAEGRLLHDAFHDALTGLANRTLFMDHLQQTIKRGRRKKGRIYAVLFLDFDRFKIINDSLGHAEGDSLLKQIAHRLEESMRLGDLVARLGGDEFTILLDELNSTDDALQIAERIQNDLKTPFILNEREIFISASIGIALSSAGHTSAEDMLRDADIAMYSAKAKGKAQFQVFDQSMHTSALTKLQFETEMRQALQKGEFYIDYQPIIELANNKLSGFEALVRWNHPERGTVSPGEFIPVAEESGLVVPLGRWILYESCRQMREWQKNDPQALRLKVSVNLSTKQFSQPDLVEQVTAALISTQLEAHCLKLEITESQVMENSDKAVTMMNRLRSLGIEISLDDFGTGYSSLSYLHRLPVNYLKIDRSFVSRMVESTENGEIVHTIIKLAQNLKMRVVAEGIETAEQLAKLKQLNCELGQGYFFSKPLKAEQVEAFIEKNRKEAKDSTFLHDEHIINLELNM